MVLLDSVVTGLSCVTSFGGRRKLIAHIALLTPFTANHDEAKNARKRARSTPEESDAGSVASALPGGGQHFITIVAEGDDLGREDR